MSSSLTPTAPGGGSMAPCADADKAIVCSIGEHTFSAAVEAASVGPRTLGRVGQRGTRKGVGPCRIW